MDDAIKNIESIFRSSTSPDELFDAFRNAIGLRIDDIELYKILLANPSISTDEIKMYTEKLLREFSEKSFQINIWAARIFENRSNYYEHLESAVYYYEKAAAAKPTDHTALVELLKLYNTEIDLPINKKILEIVEERSPAVNLKSKVYFELADLYKKKGDLVKGSRYLALAEKAAEREPREK